MVARLPPEIKGFGRFFRKLPGKCHSPAEKRTIIASANKEETSHGDNFPTILTGGATCPFPYLPSTKWTPISAPSWADPDAAGILPERGFVPLSAMEEVCRRFLREEKLGALGSRLLLPVLHRLPQTPRFQPLRLGDYVRKAGKEEQFSALTAELPDGVRCVVFRGTDDTIAAWKEDLLLTVRDVVKAPGGRRRLPPAGRRGGTRAADRRRSLQGRQPLGLRRPQGAAEVQNRLLAVYNFDGPGFRSNLLSTRAYGRIRARVHTIASQHTVVAKLLCHESRMEIVKSTRSGAAAHDGLRWEVLGTRFVRCGAFSLFSRSFDAAMEDLQKNMGQEGWEAFIDGLFGVLEATGAVTLTDLTAHKLRKGMALAKELRQSPEVYRFFLRLAGKTTKHTLLGATAAIPARIRRKLR